ncbi:MAG: hypothetical protein KBC32_08580 [Candidatus Didemnitutus sp.]|nr:hypothetical protein [Candidatus Didemnitutus sp.]
MKKISLLITIMALSLAASAQTVYVNETFDTDTIGIAPTDSSLKTTNLVTVQAGSGLMGTDNLLRFNDNSASAGGAVEYNVGASAVGSLYASFNLFNNAHSGTGSGTNPIIFGVGAWNTGTGILLNANASRNFGLEFSANGTTSTLKLRIGGSAAYTTTYAPASVQSVQIWVNDHNTNTLTYTRPDNYQSATLAANSVVVYINNVLTGSSASGYTIQTLGDGSDATMGRVGFNTSSSNLADFLIDDIYIASAAPIPEPSTYAAIAGLAALGLCVWQRRRTRQA